MPQPPRPPAPLAADPRPGHGTAGGTRLLWLRHDLRVADHPALTAACAGGGPVAALYVLEESVPWAPGAAQRVWLHHSLQALAADLEALGVPLVLRRGDPAVEVPTVARDVGAVAVHWTRRHGPAAAADDQVARALDALAVAVTAHEGSLLLPIDMPQTGGQPYRVFTPFWKALWARRQEIPPPLPAPRAVATRSPLPMGLSLDLAALGLIPTRPDWSGGIRASWTFGEAAARTRLETFLDGPIRDYRIGRNLPAEAGTSRLSPALALGEISPRQIWQRVHQMAGPAGPDADAQAFLAELGWREFNARHLAAHHDLATAPLDRRFAAFAWDRDDRLLQAWQRGRTGYPIVDAGMRQLWHSGWMHNRVRMVVASFLIKHLLIDWQTGERWFWDTLVDADLASNAGNWQWVAGCGADAAPFFRVFNPTLQGQKFDPDGSYVRRWVPELADVPPARIHTPGAGGSGRGYPAPVVEHGAARARALAAFKAITHGPGSGGTGPSGLGPSGPGPSGLGPSGLGPEVPPRGPSAPRARRPHPTRARQDQRQ